MNDLMAIEILICLSDYFVPDLFLILDLLNGFKDIGQNISGLLFLQNIGIGQNFLLFFGQYIFINIIVIDKGAIYLFEEQIQVLFSLEDLSVEIIVLLSLLRQSGVGLIELRDDGVDFGRYLGLVLLALISG